ncbi:hypothetical protein [Fodinibius halophilus]|uniref:Uncharacterized protein n=1 Tax=Fodinibius halophilus TaxID=1736908 RepID=A0A6M1TPE2_9BACT|nr:hypothetical protein [Fodinibius halophilus]NGP90190.1 hypothetical protein [Fodinibius halophilus]
MSDPQELLSKTLKGIVNFEDATLARLLNLFELKHFDKDYHYAKAGEYSKRMGF